MSDRRTPEGDLRRELEDDEFRRSFGAELARTELALLIARVRQASGLSQQELAEKTGYSPDYLIRMEEGRGRITLDSIGGLLAMLGLQLRMTTEPLTVE